MNKTDYLLILGLAFGLIAGVAAGIKSERIKCQKQAIEAGVARFTVNSTNGTTKFEYISPLKP